MRTISMSIGLVSILGFFSVVGGQTMNPDSRISVGGFLGYQDGVSVQAFAAARDFANGFPLRARFRVARTTVEPGSALTGTALDSPA